MVNLHAKRIVRIRRKWTASIRQVRAALSRAENFVTGGSTTPYPTASKKSIAKWGKRFIETFDPITFSDPKLTLTVSDSQFESRKSLKLYHRIYGTIGQVRIGFTAEGVVVEAIQGERGQGARMKEIRSILHGKSWQSLLIQILEEHAKKTGYRYIRIRRPETLNYYQMPIQYEMPRETIQARMRETYYRTAYANGYRKKDTYFVKYL